MPSLEDWADGGVFMCGLSIWLVSLRMDSPHAFLLGAVMTWVSLAVVLARLRRRD